MLAGRLARISVVAIVVGLLVAGCGNGAEDLTTQQMLEKLAGRTLTSTEVEEQLELADLLCGFDGRVLAGIWDQLDARQLEFQDYVFAEHCGERLSVYVAARPSTGTVPPSVTTTTTTAPGGPPAQLGPTGRAPSTTTSTTVPRAATTSSTTDPER